MRIVPLLMATLLVSACSDPQATLSTTPAPIKGKAVTVDPWHVIDAFEVGPDVYVRSLALEPKSADKGDSVWVGTSTGVHEVDLTSQNLRTTFTRAEGLANEYVFSLFVDRDNGKWFGTNGGGASHYIDSKWQVLFPMHGLADYWVYSFAQQADGGLWIGTWAGANFIPAGGGQIKTYLKELVNEWVYGIGVDSKQRVWFGTEGGISMFDAGADSGQEWRAWTHKDGLGAANVGNLPISLNTGLGTRSRHDLNVISDGQSTYNPSYVLSVHVDNKDTVWAGTWGGGVSYYAAQNVRGAGSAQVGADKQWRNYTTQDGLAGDVVYSIAEGKDGSLWFGTDRGVSRFDGKQWYSYGREQGLLSDHVYAIVVVPGNEVWVGTRGGVTRLGTAVVAEQPAAASSGKTNEN
ncbi:MAG: two-component regulator propeller domain-containing protein [Pseudomonadota bacterium]|nr:two-component regulator propeller domain-containing protein [Pseudomonadota bacterium]